jgi:hypothetical protein
MLGGRHGGQTVGRHLDRSFSARRDLEFEARRRSAPMLCSIESSRNCLMNTDELATKFAKKFGFGPTKNKDATAARLMSSQEVGKKAFEDTVIRFLR